MNFETVHEGRLITAGITVDLYAVDAANGTHWVERFHDLDLKRVIGVRVLHPCGTEPQVCELVHSTDISDWIACIEKNIVNDQRRVPLSGGRLIEEVELPS